MGNLRASVKRGLASSANWEGDYWASEFVEVSLEEARFLRIDIFMAGGFGGGYLSSEFGLSYSLPGTEL